MPAYHSELICNQSLGNMAFMPLKNEGNIRGNAPMMHVNHGDPEASRDIMREMSKNGYVANAPREIRDQFY